MSFKYQNILRNLPRLLRNPFADLELVLELTEAVADTAPVRAAYGHLLSRIPAAEARRLEALTREPIPLERLRALPAATFGAQLARFLDDNHLNPTYYFDLYPPVRRCIEENWLLWRFAKCHDMHHALLGVDISIAEEFGLQVFNCLNFGEPLSVASVAIAPYILLRYPGRRRALASAAAAIRLAPRAPNLLTFPFEECYGEDLRSLRARCRVPAAGMGAALWDESSSRAPPPTRGGAAGRRALSRPVDSAPRHL